MFIIRPQLQISPGAKDESFECTENTRIGVIWERALRSFSQLVGANENPYRNLMLI